MYLTPCHHQQLAHRLGEGRISNCHLQVCTHLERLTSELEAAAHPALDALTNKVHMHCPSPQCRLNSLLYLCLMYCLRLIHYFTCVLHAGSPMSHTMLVCVIYNPFPVCPKLLAKQHAVLVESVM